MTPEQEAAYLDAEQRCAALRDEYTSDSDAFSALSLIVSRLALQVPAHVRAAFSEFFEED